jgi:alkaline phosphatase
MTPRRTIAAIACAIVLFAAPPLRGGAGAEPSPAPPRNIIFLVGDGMGFNHVRCASFYEHGRAGALAFESWPVAVAMSTYPADGEGYDPAAAARDAAYVGEHWTDSAAAATTFSSGVKTDNGVLGLDPEGRPVVHLVDWLEDRGKSTGLVSSVQFAHATPAGFCVHEQSRGQYESIARQMLLESRVDVIMGCGHPLFDMSGRPRREAKSYAYVGGEALWAGLIAGATEFDTDGDGAADRRVADADGDGTPDPWTLIRDRDAFLGLNDRRPPPRVLGVPEVAYTLQADRAGVRGPEPFTDPFVEGVPSLAEMTRGALNVLACDPDGFFLMVEGGAIDWASHDKDAARMVEELLFFESALVVVQDWIEANSDWTETLVLLTSDHECGHLLGAAPDDQEPWPPIVGRGRRRMPATHWASGTHTNDLVPFYARGAGAERFLQAADELDPRHGPYLDNREIVPTLKSLWEKKIGE